MTAPATAIGDTSPAVMVSYWPRMRPDLPNDPAILAVCAMKVLAQRLLSAVLAANSSLGVNDRLQGSRNDRDTDDTGATFAGYRRGLILSSWRSARLGAAPT